MSSCRILTNEQVTDLLTSLSRDEVKNFLRLIGESLIAFSVGEERQFQPEPAVVKRPDGRKTLFRLFTSSTGVGTKIIVDPQAAIAKEQQKQPDAKDWNKLKALHGILVVCDQNGFTKGLINAEEVTGFRTTLSALLLYVHREKTSNIVVFGAGKQALWHIRLALTLRGDDIQDITIINRSTHRAKNLLEQVRKENDERWKADVTWKVVEEDDSSGLKNVLGHADVVFCTTPSQQPLFPPGDLRTDRDGCYLSAIGSWTVDMIEIPPEIMHHVAGRERTGTGLIIADDVPECVKASGEFVQSGLGSDQVSEAGKILKLLKGQATEEQIRFNKNLRNGFVIYKSVGVALTDLAAGQALLEIAEQRNVGIVVPEF